jgi:autophagy-related protein 9
MAYPYATRYLEQFPKDKMVQLSRFVSFIAGALAAVLGVASLLAPELFLGFEILPGQTVLFWLGILGGIYAAARAQIPEEELVLDPEYTLLNVIECTRYCPASWEGRLHSDEVRREFSQLYKPKVVVFIEDALSMILNPFVLWFALPRCADRLIDFFREFTMHVDGVGHVCSFAVFDFTRPGKNTGTSKNKTGNADDPASLREDHFAAKDNKMLASYYGFMDHYASNPGRGSRSKMGKLFPLPPAFPAMSSLGSPTQTYDFPQGNPRQSMMGFAAGKGGRQSVHGATPRFGPRDHHGSPMHSVLLDPQNQPTSMPHARGVTSSPRQTAQAGAARLRSRPQNHGERAEEAGKSLPTTSRILEEDSMLGDSWRTDQAAELDEEDGGVKTNADDPGVLGMLLNFQKAHAEGRGLGI